LSGFLDDQQVCHQLKISQGRLSFRPRRSGRIWRLAAEWNRRTPTGSDERLEGRGEFRTLAEAADWLITEAQITLPQPRDEAQP
jgi:hypothetical protein